MVGQIRAEVSVCMCNALRSVYSQGTSQVCSSALKSVLNESGKNKFEVVTRNLPTSLTAQLELTL